MFSEKRKHRTNGTMPSGRGLRRLTEKEANETVGGRAAQPNITGIGGSSDNDLSRSLGYEQG